MAANRLSDHISGKLVKARLIANSTKKNNAADKHDEDELEDHIIIMGFGINGQNVAKAAKNSNIPYAILEMNADTVRKYKAMGEPIHYGDAVELEVLRHLNIHKARVIVIAISDTHATRRIIVSVKESAPSVHMVVRTRFVAEMEELKRLGADEVVPEEFETSIEVFVRVLNKYLVPRSHIKAFINELRSDNYEMLRGTGPYAQMPISKLIPDLIFNAIEVEQSGHEIVGKTIAESGIRQNYGVTLVAIKRDDTVLTTIGVTTEIKFGDILYVFGQKDQVNEFYRAMKQ
jgi:monovalent cation:H+ antiporter-2, CPA2 family